MLFGWLKALPDEVVRRSPVLSVFYGHMLMAGGDLDGVEVRLDDAERAAGCGNRRDRSDPWADTEELRTLPATIAIYRASLAQARGDIAGTAEHAVEHSTWPAPTTISPAAARPDSSVSQPGRTVT